MTKPRPAVSCLWSSFQHATGSVILFIVTTDTETGSKFQRKRKYWSSQAKQLIRHNQCWHHFSLRGLSHNPEVFENSSWKTLKKKETAYRSDTGITLTPWLRFFPPLNEVNSVETCFHPMTLFLDIHQSKNKATDCVYKIYVPSAWRPQ